MGPRENTSQSTWINKRTSDRKFSRKITKTSIRSVWNGASSTARCDYERRQSIDAERVFSRAESDVWTRTKHSVSRTRDTTSKPLENSVQKFQYEQYITRPAY